MHILLFDDTTFVIHTCNVATFNKFYYQISFFFTPLYNTNICLYIYRLSRCQTFLDNPEDSITPTESGAQVRFS